MTVPGLSPYSQKGCRITSANSVPLDRSDYPTISDSAEYQVPQTDLCYRYIFALEYNNAPSISTPKWLGWELFTRHAASPRMRLAMMVRIFMSLEAQHAYYRDDTWSTVRELGIINSVDRSLYQHRHSQISKQKESSVHNDLTWVISRSL